MPYNTYWTYFKPDDLPKFCGPNELADCLIKGREATEDFNISYISDDDLRHLINLAYHVSLISDEGRYPRFRLFAYWSETQMEPSTIAFQEPQNLTPDVLRKLAPAFQKDAHAIIVDARDGQFWSPGVFSIEPSLGVAPPGRPEFWARIGRPSGLMVVVDGPGELLASETTLTLSLRGGTIADLVPVNAAEPVRNWLQRAATFVTTTLDGRGVTDIEHMFGGEFAVYRMLSELLSLLLELIVDERHGGALVILPKTDWQDKVRFPYRTAAMHLGDVAAEYWEACIAATTTFSKSNLRSSFVKRDELFHKMRTVASLANTDGCVGLTTELELLGFGGEIIVNEAMAKGSPIVFSSIKTGEAWPDQSGTDLGGTRHRSAYRLCKTLPNCLAFVVSQDGGLTVFSSNNEQVFCMRGLTPNWPLGL